MIAIGLICAAVVPIVAEPESITPTDNKTGVAENQQEYLENQSQTVGGSPATKR